VSFTARCRRSRQIRQINNGFAWPAQFDAHGRANDRASDQDRVLDHRWEHVLVGDIAVEKAKLRGGRFCLAERGARPKPCSYEKTVELRLPPASLQVPAAIADALRLALGDDDVCLKTR
jgi:hypothetical protein